MTVGGGAAQSSPTLGTLALRALATRPDVDAFTWDGGSMRARAAIDRIGQLQHVLAAHGLGRGSRLAILTTNHADSWCAGFAAYTSAIAVTWLHPAGSRADQLGQIVDFEAHALIVEAGHFAARGAELADDLGPSCAVFSIGAGGPGIDLLAAAMGAGSVTPVDHARADELALVNYTGGTSGRPKGAARSQAAASAMYCAATLEGFDVPDAPRYLAVAPMTHVGGTKFLPTLQRGGTVHLVDSFQAPRVLDTIARERISMCLFVPTMIYALLDCPELARTDLSSLEVILYGAAAMSPRRLGEAFERFGPIFSQFYGQTECYPISALRKAEHRPDRPELFTSCGAPLPSVDVALLDDDGQPVAPGEPGEICVRSRYVMDRYWKQPELTAETLRGGWLHTADVARADERGFLHIADRKKDMIISGGFNVYPREVEDALGTHATVLEVAVFGLPDEHWGEEVNAAVVLQAGASADERALIEHVKAQKGSVQAPKRVHFVEALPKTGLGKIDKKQLREDHKR